MTSFLARELQRKNEGVVFQRILSTRRVCTQEHLHPISSEICGDLLTDVKEMLKEADFHQRSQEERLENSLKQIRLAVDIMRNPRTVPSCDSNYAEDIKFLEEFAVNYKQGVGLSDDAHRRYIIKVSDVLRRALSTLDDEYKNVCPWSLILKVNYTDLCPHQPFCKHKQKYTQSQVPAGHPHPPGGTTHSDVMGFCQDEYVVQHGKMKPEGCKVRMYCRLQHKEDGTNKKNCDAIILYAVACLHRDGLWE
ncbi:hypothetical protein BHYA_0375g00030 [Botrytis hyacinthi]|uniref:Uncharacterized protein n=1 Tax=Botrytis hyacinthi TaxID=278943 RepID=A0A4Z1GCJ3_9HELO|nr:hypothetical protein BHYA_0375g00030 [Botrytis hyacinthi]